MSHSEYRPISSFVRDCLRGEKALDIGYKGSRVNASPIVPWAIGVDVDFPEYDGIHLPFPDQSQDAVFVSHCLEHIDDYKTALTEWYRTLKIGGYLIIMLPHQQLYERKAAPPSRFAGDHRRFYTPRSALEEIEQALPLAAWRLRSLRDVDEGFDYAVAPEEHPRGLCEIELVAQRILPPTYAAALIESPATAMLVDTFGAIVFHGIQATRQAHNQAALDARRILQGLPLPPYRRLARSLEKFKLEMNEIFAFLHPVIAAVRVDEEWYLNQYEDVRAAVASGLLESGQAHFASGAYFEGRLPGPPCPPFE